MNRFGLVSVFALLLIVPARGEEKKPRLTVEQAVRAIRKPEEMREIFGSKLDFRGNSFFLWKIEYPLCMMHRGGYECRETDKPAWKKLLTDQKADVYARLCAAYFLLDDDEEARQFVETQLQSETLRFRYNAAKMLQMYVGVDSSKCWGIEKLIEMLENGSLEHPDRHSSTQDDRFPPLDDICRSLGYMKEKKAVDALIGVLERKCRYSNAAFALGEIGDRKAIPTLLKMLKDETGDRDVVTALGKLKCKEAVPILIARLARLKATSSDSDHSETETLLQALLEIGDERAIPVIEDYLKGDFPKESKAVAKRVLVQLKENDPVAILLDMFVAETDEHEKSNLIFALVKYKDARVVAEFARIANQSDSAIMRKRAIHGLKLMGSRNALLELAALLEVEFPKKLRADWGWEYLSTDFPRYFPEEVLNSLKYATKQDLGKKRAPWAAWIEQNVNDVERAGPDNKP